VFQTVGDERGDAKYRKTTGLSGWAYASDSENPEFMDRH